MATRLRTVNSMESTTVNTVGEKTTSKEADYDSTESNNDDAVNKFHSEFLIYFGMKEMREEKTH